jgi:BlaI family penicillinase repressor
MTQDHTLSDLQMAVMRVLWGRGEATVSEVHTSLQPERSLAPTTVATILSRLEKRGVVEHRMDGRQFVYRARVTEEEVRRSMVSELTDLLFKGDPAELVSHLLAEEDIGPDELAKLKHLIEGNEHRDPEGPEDAG